ncbi:MAG: DUF1775 domain-containing protein [Methylobacteriaceae bacterium]|nr:DUF1775 domain-containing protein [Methylobacteriaceae bacterium]
MLSLSVRGAFGASALLLSVTSALSHTVLERREAQVRSSYRGVLQVTHGCEGSPTTRVAVTIPEGVVAARPMPKPGWTVATERGPYARAYPGWHGDLSEGVKEITWSGGSLPDDLFDEFTFSALISDAFRPGETVYFPVVQTCASGEHRWVEIPAAGRSARDLQSPAPSVVIAASDRPATTGATAPAPAAAVSAGTLTIEQPWIRATPGGAKVAGGYLRITNRGSEPDRLVSASVPLAARGEVHEMAMEAGVMKMREVEGGLVIPPGGTVELKPGGFHLMFLDLREPAREGETVQGTLTFEKAGTVALTFQVGGLGARSAPDGAAHHH